MRVVIFAHNLRAAGGASVGRNIVSALARVADAHEYLLVLPVGVGYEHVPKPSRGSCVYYRRRLGHLGQQVFEARTLPRLVRSFQPDIVWGLGNFGLADPGTAQQAVLFHKAQLVYDAHHQRGWEAPRLRWVNAAVRRRLRRSLAATQLVFCQTETMAQRFARAFQYRGRLALLPNAVSGSVDDRRACDRPAAWERLAGKFVLFYVTRYYPHKNLEILVELFRRHAESLRDVAVIITIGAGQHPRAGQLLATLQDPLVREHIINVGPVEQSQLAAYYTHADAVIMPTLLESFSGTYLEAMRFDRPILTSDLDFAHDVCGPAAVYFAPLDPTAIRDAILHVKESDAVRAALVAAGRERLQRYRDWDAIVLNAVRQLEQLGDREPPGGDRAAAAVGRSSVVGTPGSQGSGHLLTASLTRNAPRARYPCCRGKWRRRGKRSMETIDKLGLYGTRLVRRPRYYAMRLFGRFVTVQRAVRRLPGAAPRAARNGAPSVFTDLDPAAAVTALRRDGIYVGMQLPQATLDAIRHYADTAMCYANFDPTLGFPIARLAEAREKIGPIAAAEYFNAAEDCPAIKQLATDPVLLEVASRYFRRRAEWMGSLLRWTMVNSASHLKATYGQMFHFDLDDYAVLKYFFYLTPVDELGGPHVCVRGSHRTKRMRASYYSPGTRLMDEQVEGFYGRDNITQVFGPGGTGFALDPFCIHKGSVPVQQPRLALQVQFVRSTYGFPYGTHDPAALKSVF